MRLLGLLCCLSATAVAAVPLPLSEPDEQVAAHSQEWVICVRATPPSDSLPDGACLISADNRVFSLADFKQYLYEQASAKTSVCICVEPSVNWACAAQVVECCAVAGIKLVTVKVLPPPEAGPSQHRPFFD